MQQPTVFQVLINERRWHRYEVFRQKYEAAARELADRQGPASMRTCTIGKRQFLRWAHGNMEGLPRTEAQRILEYLFQVSAEDLFAVRPQITAPGARRVEENEPTGSNALGLGHGNVEDVVMAAAHESARFALGAEQSNVGPHTLEQMDADIRRIVTTYPNRPVEPLFLETKELRDRAFELLEGRQPPAYTKDLYLAAGTLCGILANASFDLGRYDAAETQARAGFLCAELAGHNALRAWLRGLQALMAYWVGRPRDAVRLAQAGHDFEPEQGSARIRLAGIEARAHAQMNQAGDALAALHLADRLREELQEDDSPGGMMAFPLAKQMYCASSAHLWLGGSGHLSDAEERAEEAIDLFEADPPEQRRLGELCLARLDLATTRLGRGDLDGASDQIHTVISLSSRRSIESVNRRIEQFGHQLSAHPAGDSPGGVGLREAIFARRAQTSSELPPGATAS